jgi:hypothetical protein
VIFGLIAFGGLMVALSTGSLSSLFMPIFVMGMAIFAWFSMRVGDRKKLQLLKFALDNGWVINFAGIKNFAADPLLFQQGHSRMVTYWMQEPTRSLLFANYQYTVGYGKNSHTYVLNFAQIPLPRRVPHLILNSKHNNFGAPTLGYDVEKVKVEGDFNKFFKIITPPEYERDALQILTPDVLQVLKEFGAWFDFEMLDDKLFVFAMPGTLDDGKAMQGLLTAIAKIVPEITHQVQTYSDAKATRMAVGTTGDVTSASAQNVVAAGGVRLKRSKVALLVVPIAIGLMALWFLVPFLSALFSR